MLRKGITQLLDQWCIQITCFHIFANLLHTACTIRNSAQLMRCQCHVLHGCLYAVPRIMDTAKRHVPKSHDEGIGLFYSCQLTPDPKGIKARHHLSNQLFSQGKGRVFRNLLLYLMQLQRLIHIFHILTSIAAQTAACPRLLSSYSAPAASCGYSPFLLY